MNFGGSISTKVIDLNKVLFIVKLCKKIINLNNKLW